nr:hypothetical protein [Tanacetum cinerariifolium]
MNVIIPTKRNMCISDMMTFLSNRYERQKKISQELGLDLSVLLPEQDPSLPKKKRKPMELRINDIHKVVTETMLGYKVMDFNVKSIVNQRFNVLMSKMIDKRPGNEKIMTKRVKLENLGYTNV